MASSQNNLALALMGIGQQLPSMIRNNRDYKRELALDPLRRKLLESQTKGADLSNDKTAMDLAMGQDEIDTKAAANSALGETINAMNTQNLYDKLPETIRDPDYQKKPIRDIAMDTGLPKYAGDPNVKQFTSDFIEKPEANAIARDKIDKLGKGGGTNVWSQKNSLYQNHPEAVENLARQLERLHNNGKLDDDIYEQNKNRLIVDPASVDIAMAEYLMKPAIAANTITAQTAPKVNQEYALIAPKAATTEATTGAGENTKRKIQSDNPILSENQGGALQDAYAAVGYLNEMKDAITKGNVDWFDQTIAGEIKNPKMNNARNQIVEIVGRKRSGAAISESEWKNFQNQVLNKNYLLTDAGKQEALNNLDNYLDRFYGAGVTTTGNEDWFNNYKSKAKSARAKAEPAPTPATPTKASSYLDEIRARRAAKK